MGATPHVPLELFELPEGVEAGRRRNSQSPKRPHAETAGLADIFPYYAGFSFDWARTALAQLSPDGLPVVLDPWNGSGTTTLAAQSLGMPSVGVDLNPVASVVAQLRAQVREVASVSQPPAATAAATADISDDPLKAWFTSPTVARLRAWTEMLDSQPRAAAALGYVALFRTVRNLTRGFEGSNPTWVKRAASDDDLVDVPVARLDVLLTEDQERIRQRLKSLPASETSVAVVTASSRHLPVRDETVDLFLTSPPYLTRIDYAVAYARELAVCGVNIAADRRLRSELRGTTLIRPPLEPRADLGDIACHLVEQVSTHQSKAASGYYRKQVLQYLDDLTASLDEIDRVAKPGAQALVVVQDSYFKDVHVRLADICGEEMATRGWDNKPTSKRVERILTSLNTAARAYAKGEVHETVLSLTKGMKR